LFVSVLRFVEHDIIRRRCPDIKDVTSLLCKQLVEKIKLITSFKMKPLSIKIFSICMSLMIFLFFFATTTDGLRPRASNTSDTKPVTSNTTDTKPVTSDTSDTKPVTSYQDLHDIIVNFLPSALKKFGLTSTQDIEKLSKEGAPLIASIIACVSGKCSAKERRALFVKRGNVGEIRIWIGNVVRKAIDRVVDGVVREVGELSNVRILVDHLVRKLACCMNKNSCLVKVGLIGVGFVLSSRDDWSTSDGINDS